MTPDQFARALRRDIVEENLATYRDLFANNSPSGASDPYWQKALGLFESLSPEQRLTLFEIMRQVSVDTVSNVLGVIDGVNSVDNFTEEFKLIYEGDQRLSGDLQSLFLIEDERLSQSFQS